MFSIRFLFMSVAIMYSSLSASLLLAVQEVGQDRNKESQSADATVSDGIENYVGAVNIAIAELQRPGPNEFDVRISVAVADGKEEAIKSVDIVFPSEKVIAITREKRDFGGNEHYSVASRQEDSEQLVFSYFNIGEMSVKQYGSGDYVVRVNHESGSGEILIPSVDAATGAKLQRPHFPEFMSKLEGTIASPVVVDIKKIELDAGLFFGKANEESGGFSEVVERQIRAGETTSGPIELGIGNWGGDIGVASKNSGVAKGITWSISFSAVVEFDFTVK